MFILYYDEMSRDSNKLGHLFLMRNTILSWWCSKIFFFNYKENRILRIQMPNNNYI